MTEINRLKKEIEFRQNLIGEGFINPPEGNFHRINIFGEISFAMEFVEDNLYVFYEFDLPFGWKIDDENEYYQIYKSEHIEEENINKLKSVSHITNATVVKIGNRNLYHHNFCIPFELELLCHDAVLNKSWPKLLIQVNSLDNWERSRVEGYTFTMVPKVTGFYSLDLLCYKPREDIYQKIYSYFLGGSRKIPEIKEIAKSSSVDEEGVAVAMNRYGIQTDYSGMIRVNINVTRQSLDLMKKAKRKVKDRKGNDFYKLTNYVEKDNFEFEDENYMTNDAMRSQFGLINRFTGK